MDITKVTQDILAREGGFVDDPDDPGGATNYGITLKTLQHLERDLNKDGQTNIADLKALTPDYAADIYERFYYYKPNINSLPTPLQPSVYDMYVNAGANAVRILQELLGAFGFPTAVDGVIGPKTIEAAANAYAVAPDHLVDAYGIARRNYYYALGDKRPASRKYAKRRNGDKGGWIRRAEEFISAEYHMSRSAHDKRVEKWVS